MRLIDADALADALFEKRKNYPQWVSDTIGGMPDAVVRCRDCKHYRYYGLSQDTVSECMVDICTNPNDDWFCAEGERRETE